MIGKKLRELRLARGLTLEQLANELNNKYAGSSNFNKGRISKWENNKDEPLLSSVRILADYFGISVDALLSDSSDSYLLSIYNRLNAERQKKVDDYTQEQLKLQELDTIKNQEKSFNRHTSN